ncbi:MAG: YiiD C-terminal domain-containing protein [Pseudomonadota bacterium]
MNITEIPFNKFIEILSYDKDKSCLHLEFKDQMKNHLGTMHASAQFSLAEACSGLCLQRCFPQLENSVVPILRKSEVKFKRPAISSIRAQAEIMEENQERFEKQLERKGRATIEVAVNVLDQDGTITMSGNYEWFAQRI